MSANQQIVIKVYIQSKKPSKILPNEMKILKNKIFDLKSKVHQKNSEIKNITAGKNFDDLFSMSLV